MKKRAKSVPLTDDVLRFALVKSLRPHIRKHIIENNCQNLAEVLTHARVAELTEPLQAPSVEKLAEELRAKHKLFEAELRKISDWFASVSVTAIVSVFLY